MFPKFWIFYVPFRFFGLESNFSNPAQCCRSKKEGIPHLAALHQTIGSHAHDTPTSTLHTQMFKAHIHPHDTFIYLWRICTHKTTSIIIFIKMIYCWHHHIQSMEHLSSPTAVLAEDPPKPVSQVSKNDAIKKQGKLQTFQIMPPGAPMTREMKLRRKPQTLLTMPPRALLLMQTTQYSLQSTFERMPQIPNSLSSLHVHEHGDKRDNGYENGIDNLGRDVSWAVIVPTGDTSPCQGWLQCKLWCRCRHLAWPLLRSW